MANAKSIHFPFCFQSNYSENNNNGQVEETRLCGLFRVYLKNTSHKTMLIPIKASYFSMTYNHEGKKRHSEYDINTLVKTMVMLVKNNGLGLAIV